MASIETKLKPWIAPNFARVERGPRPRQEGVRVEEEGIPVQDLPQETLDELAGEWLGNLYDKAGKPSPWSAE